MKWSFPNTFCWKYNFLYDFSSYVFSCSLFLVLQLSGYWASLILIFYIFLGFALLLRGFLTLSTNACTVNSVAKYLFLGCNMFYYLSKKGWFFNFFWGFHLPTSPLFTPNLFFFLSVLSLSLMSRPPSDALVIYIQECKTKRLSHSSVSVGSTYWLLALVRGNMAEQFQRETPAINRFCREESFILLSRGYKPGRQCSERWWVRVCRRTVSQHLVYN